MKWNNKGYEYKEISRVWCKVEKIYVYGASENAKDIFELLRFLNVINDFEVKVVDSKMDLWEKGFWGIEVISLPKMLELIQNTKYVIVDCTYTNSISSILQKYQLIKLNENLFTYDNFVRVFLPVLMWYKYQKAFCYTVAVHFSTKCNLRCKGCGVFTDKYNKKRNGE